MSVEFIEPEKTEKGTEEQLRLLTQHSKRLRSLRDKRDQLRAELAMTEEQIRGAAEHIGTLTAALADNGTDHPKRRNGKE